MAKVKVEGSIFKVGNEPFVMPPLVRKMIEEMKKIPVTTFEVPKEQWEKLSPSVKEMIRKGQVTYIISTPST